MPSSVTGLDPLKHLFEGILGRLEALESKVGVAAPSSGSLSAGSSHGKSTPRPGTKRLSVVHVSPGDAAESVKAFDEYIKTSVMPLALTCDELGGMDDIGKHLLDAWDGIRGIIVLATKSKAPEEELSTALAPHLVQTQDSIKAIQAMKVDRDWDRHYKAISEMLPCNSWVLCKSPKMLPSNCAKDAIGAAEFWTNKIRKDFKDDEAQQDFCNNIKKSLVQLAAYIEKFHMTGLAWNPKGVSLAEAAVVMAEPPEDKVPKSPIGSKRRASGMMGGVVGGNLTGLVSELAAKRSADGSSAATGLRKVTKDQQTWRKEFNKDGSKAAAAPAPKPKPVKVEKKKLTGLPIFEYQDRGHKWVIENHTAESAKKESANGIMTVDIADPKQQVYIYNCHGITVKVNGEKFKSLILDKCEKVNVVFTSVISSTEVVNCKKLQLQTDGICPVFTIDKTVGCLIWLSKESAAVSSFLSSMSSELNVNFPDGDDMKELPIPEQFVHKLEKGSLKSGVSDLYH